MLAEAVNATRTEVVAALQRASAATGSDFNYLLNTAMRESSLKPQAQSNASSAAGLFQFVEQTWLGLVKEHGAAFGLGSYANAISKSTDGHYHADNPEDRHAILALRKDPQASAYMAGVFARDERAKMQSTLGRDVCGGELYAAHFLGTDAACKLIQLTQTDPSASAAKEFPQAAGANRTVFYHANGSPKSVKDVYDWALSAHGDAPLSSAPPAAADNETQKANPSSLYFGNPGDDARLANAELAMLAPSWMTPGLQGQGDAPPLPASPLAMSSGVIDLLSSMSPALPVAKRSDTP
ncbi:MAG TPA: transglycosylase SLT domain-containing protein [Rhizomicrobium sp.]|jgi:hypothetical protein